MSSDCTEACRAIVRCEVCGLTKKPIERDLAPGGFDMCDGGCPGYLVGTYPPHLWPGENLEKKGDPFRGGGRS